MIKRLQLWEVSQKGILWVIYAVVMLAVISVLLPCANAQTPIAVQNPSFDSTVTWNNSNSTGSWTVNNIPNWVVTGTPASGVYLPASSVFTSTCSGSQVVFSNGSTVSQDLGVTAQPNGSYNLNVCVGHRLDGFTTTSTIQLMAGTTSLCSLTVDPTSIAAGTFANQSLNCPTGATPPSGNLGISLACASNQCDWDAISLTFAPANHSIVTSWQASNTPNVTYNVYRAQGNSCTNFIQLANGLSVLTYTDSTVVFPNVYCYKVKAFDGTTESDAISIGIAVQ